MAAEIKVTDSALQAAMDAYAAKNEELGEPVEYFPDAMEAALQAGLAAMLEPVGYLYVGLRQTDLLTARDFDGSEEKLTKWAATVGAPTAYRIKPE